MTGPVADVLRRPRHVLLDFDGPVCAVFGGVTDQAVAARLREFLTDLGFAVPHHVRAARDPFEVLFFASLIDADTAHRTHVEFTRLEVEAVASAPATPGAAEAIRSLASSGRTVTVVSNNSRDAVCAYLRAHDLAGHVTGVSARTTADPTRLKPNTFLLDQAVEHLGAAAGECVMVGDSTADVQAAKAAWVPSIAYANKPGKRKRFETLQPDAIIEDMADLAAAVAPN
jgi:HAD superfamily hydrolase (TIGR01662 family)